MPRPRSAPKMIQRSKKHIVLFLPHRANPAEGVRVAADLTPLELLQIATFPVQEGYEVHLVDAMIHEDYLEQLMELCEGALLFASSCILGYQVAHGAEVARVVRERFPDLPIIWGGWFPSCYPRQYFVEGIADAVALGQGEMTFWEVVQALENGTPLDDVPGLALWRDGEMVKTASRVIVGFDKIPPVPWHLLEFEKYVELQNDPGSMKVRHRYPDPLDWKEGEPFRGFSFFSSYGCPEPCTFCCSPIVTSRRWKAIAGDALAEDLLELQDRFKFNIVRFQDANFGVAEKRSNAFCEKLIEHGSPFHWNATYEIETVARYKESSVDLLGDSRMHLAVMGAEAGSEEQQTNIKKKIDLEDHLTLALDRLYDRKITTGCTWIIGYPGESQESMLQTLRMAAMIKLRYKGSASDIFPFRAIPGSEDYETALKLGYEPPTALEEWGSHLEYKLEYDDVHLPPLVERMWKRYHATASLYDGHIHEGSRGFRSLLGRIAAWRLGHNNYAFPIEQKMLAAWVRVSGQTSKDKIQQDRASGVTPHPVGS